jgi:hypothetical protein
MGGLFRGSADIRGDEATSMRERAGVAVPRVMSGWGQWLGASALVCGVALLAPSLSGCAVSDSDIEHWELTENGPDKLYSVLTHDKFSWDLRVDAAMALVRMKPRDGEHVGLETFLKAMASKDGLTQTAREKIIDAIAPKIESEMQQEPTKSADGFLDPSVPYKDAAYGMLIEPGLVTDDKTRADLTLAVTNWVQTDFEMRIDNRGQAYGVEQIMRTLGSSSVKSLPTYIKEESTKVDRIAQLVADLGDDATKKACADALVALAKVYDSAAWLDKQKALVAEANKKSSITVTADQAKTQLADYQKGEIEKVFGSMKKVGQRPIVDYVFAYAADPSKNPEARSAAVAVLQGNLDKNNQGDVDRLYNIAKDDKNPDDLRGLALDRMGDFSKDFVVPRLYALFNGKKWQTRLDAGGKLIEILKPMDQKAITDFMNHLPVSPTDKMGKNEAAFFGLNLVQMDPVAGKKPRDILNTYLSSKSEGPRLVAIGQYFGGKKADAAPIMGLQDDTMPLPKCDDSDKCDWQCVVPKAPGSKETMSKKLATVGDYVKDCVIPSLN